ncbi:MAG: BON domain-containing protein [Chitinivibrionales bacterium]|nr:BON domain-containing protein [Chitinivibrionales bacterium]
MRMAKTYHRIFKRIKILFLLLSIAGLCAVWAQKETLEVTDQNITLAVETDLSTDNAVAAHLIDVETSDGYVTLSGTVDNILAKERAAKLARSIKGVKGVINTITVNPVYRSDIAIRNNVNAVLLFDKATESYEITVSVDTGKVFLDGTVQSLAERKIAEKAAKSVTGVVAVENNIDVVPTEKRSDKDIKAEIVRKLELDPYVYEEMIDVKVDDGEVVLSGTVGSLAEKGFAYNDAAILGVKTIDDRKLVVKLWANDPLRRKGKLVVKPEDDLAGHVEAILNHDPRVSDYDIDVSVDGSTIILDGVVDNLNSALRARQDALNVVGVYRVINRLRVRPEKLLSSSEIEENAEYILKWDPVVERHEISVTLRNAKAYLEGKVDSRYEKMHAEEIVSRIPGVVNIENLIAVREKPWVYINDDVLESNIQQEFRFNWFVDEEDLKVEAMDGVATVTGDIESKRELYAIVDNAFDAGAKMVKTRLEFNGIPDYMVFHYRDPIWFE